MNISIIIPTYNRKEKLKQCLESLFRQDYPEDDFEIIVIDDGSSDETSDLLKGLSQKHQNLRYLLQPRRGPAVARNLGINAARADIIGFTDDDCILKNDWARKMVEAHRSEPDITAVGGQTKVNIHHIGAAVSQFLSDGAIKADFNGSAEVIFFPTCNVSFKKHLLNGERFRECFPLPAGEDAEFFWRIFKGGRKFVHKHDIEVFHNCHSSLKSFLRQAYFYGRGNYLVEYIHHDHPWFGEIKVKDAPSFLLGTLINLLKIPRFSFLLGRSLAASKNGEFSLRMKMRIHFYFALHKIMYVAGNMAEHRRVARVAGHGLGIPSAGQKQFSPKPEFIILDTTHRCNLKCNICEIRKDKPITELSTDEIRDLMVQAMDWGVKEFVLSGGEPFMRDDIWEILSFVREKRYHVGILTNGILLNQEFLSKLLPFLTSGSLSLSISLDALTPDIHDDIRGKRGSFDRTANGLRLLSQLKKNDPQINFNVITIILNNNLEEIIPLVNFLQSLGVNSIQLQPLLVNNLTMKDRSSKSKYWILQERLHLLDGVIDDLIEFKRLNPALIRNSENNLLLFKKYFRGLLTETDVTCLYITKTMLIANNGDVSTCYERYGNVRQKSLREIYASREAGEARKKTMGCRKPCLLPCFCD